jgi:Ca2+:H+ antiporter
LNCLSCVDTDDSVVSRDCRRCYFAQTPALDDRFYLEAVRPYCWFAAVLLFLSYAIGLWFTLRTHAAVIWNNEADEKKAQETNPLSNSQQLPHGPPHSRLQRHGSTQNSSGEAATRGAEIRESQLYKRILGQSLKQVGLGPREEPNQTKTEPAGLNGSVTTPHLPPPKSSGGESVRSDFRIPGLSDTENTNLVREVAEMAATAAAIAARDATRAPRKTSVAATAPVHPHKQSLRPIATHEDGPVAEAEAHASGGGHDAPNWSRMKSSVILCGATVLYALIAEILVNTVDVVLKNVAIDEKFLGITLFALVPNTTEFLV